MPAHTDTTDEELHRVIAELRRRAAQPLSMYQPYPKQQLFHAMGLTKKQRLLRAGNQNGKTHAGGMETAYHATGLYPHWWTGARVTKANPLVWASSDTGETTRDNPQRALLGIVGEMGTGSIPPHCILDAKNARGVADLLDYAKIQHHNSKGEPDGVTTLRFKYYEQGRQRWQGPPVDVLWYDEEPPEDVYSEGLARTIATDGIVYTTFTPLLGMSGVVMKFLRNPGPDRCDINMTIEDALHIPAERRASIIEGFRSHERDARTRGIPILGSGRVFPVAEGEITYNPEERPLSQMPSYWAHIGGLDFGWDHPTAAVRLVHDRDSDVIYIPQAYRRNEQLPMVHASAVRGWGKWIPWAWPHDGLQHDKSSGQQLAEQYREEGLSMLWEKATFEDGTNGREAGVQMMLYYMQTGRLKVARDLLDWFEEFRLYHRKDGVIVMEHDDLMSATRYAFMMLRFAMSPREAGDADSLDYSELYRTA